MELLKRFRQGDPEAFEALFRQCQGEVYGWIVRVVRDPSAAEDLTLETFWRIYRARGRFDPGGLVRRLGPLHRYESRDRSPPAHALRGRASRRSGTARL